MSVQTSYTIEHAKAYAGMVFSVESHNTVSRMNKGSSVIPYGKGVVTDGENGAQLPTGGSTAEQFNGVVMYEINRAQQDGDVAGATVGRDMTVVTHGEVWVLATETVAKDDPVFLRVGATNTGDFSNAAGTGATLSVGIAGAKFTSGGGSGDLVKVSFGIGG